MRIFLKSVIKLIKPTLLSASEASFVVLTSSGFCDGMEGCLLTGVGGGGSFESLDSKTVGVVGCTMEAVEGTPSSFGKMTSEAACGNFGAEVVLDIGGKDSLESLDICEMVIEAPGTLQLYHSLLKLTYFNLTQGTYVYRFLGSVVRKSHRPGRVGAPSCGVPK